MEWSFTKKSLSLIIIVGIGMLLGHLSIWAIFNYLGSSMPPDFSVLLKNPSDAIWVKAGIGISHFLSFTLSSYIFAKVFYPSSTSNYLGFKYFNLDYLLYFLVLLMVSYPLIAATVHIIQSIELPEWAEQVDQNSIDMLTSLLAMDSPISFLINLTIVALLPALGEELLFRGIIQQEMLKKIEKPTLAIFISSIIFSAFHLQLAGFLPKLIIGIILGYSFYMSKSIWVPIIIHFFNNGIQVVGLYIAGDDISSLSANDEVDFPWVSVLISIFLCFFVVRLIKNVNQKNSKV